MKTKQELEETIRELKVRGVGQTDDDVYINLPLLLKLLISTSVDLESNNLGLCVIQKGVDSGVFAVLFLP